MVTEPRVTELHIRKISCCRQHECPGFEHREAWGSRIDDYASIDGPGFRLSAFPLNIWSEVRLTA